MSMGVKIEVNGVEVKAETGETILSVLQRLGIDVPTLCHVPGLPPSGACRLCVVEMVGHTDLIPSCSFPVEEGMQILTHSPRVLRARKTLVELLLAEHPDDCLYCARNNDCKLQRLASQLGVRDRHFAGDYKGKTVDETSLAIVREPAKCILCGRCVRVCEEVQGVSCIDFACRGSETTIETSFGNGLGASTCVDCGQCVVACPTGALHEKSHLECVEEALFDPDTFVVVQHAPSISVSLAEAFDMKPGTDLSGQLNAALRLLGVDRIYDTSFAADLVVMEEASELLLRLNSAEGPLPLLTSCSPGWVKFVETSYPEFLPYVSTCKSPQQMLGALIKSHYAQAFGVAPERIFCVSIMPCTAKKTEAARVGMGQNGMRDVDAVLTTREFVKLLRFSGINMLGIKPEKKDMMVSQRSGAGKIFGVSGGVMEAVLRTAHYLSTGREMKDMALQALRGTRALKETRVTVGKRDLKVATVSGLKTAGELLKRVKAGEVELDLIEVMACPGGCIAGGGQLYNVEPEKVQARARSLYELDRSSKFRVAHRNEEVRRLYDAFLQSPLSEHSIRYLHTSHGAPEV